MADNFERDAEELTAMLLSMGEEIPQKAITAAARAGANVVKHSIVGLAPVRTHALRSSIILNKERSRVEGKAVYDVIVDPGKNSIFQKPIIHPDRSTSKHAYYPASQEYGFFVRRPHGGLSFVSSLDNQVKKDRVPGKYFMRTGTNVAEASAEDAIIKKLEKEIDKICR